MSVPNDIMVLVQRKPLAGIDLLAALGRQIHAAQQLVRSRSARNPNEVIEEQASFGNRIADTVAGFGGSWSFILSCRGQSQPTRFSTKLGSEKGMGILPPERRLVRFDRAGESVIVADLLAQIGHRFGIDASLTIDLGFSA